MTVLAMAQRLGLPIHDNMGRLLYGEHVWRISGARHCNRHQVDLPTLMRLARWGSDVVLRYLADAPLSTLTLNYRKAVVSAYRGEHVAENSSLTSVDVERIVSQQFREAAIERSSVDASLEALSACVNALVARIDHDHGEFTARVATLSSQLDSEKVAHFMWHLVWCSTGLVRSPQDLRR